MITATQMKIAALMQGSFGNDDAMRAVRTAAGVQYEMDTYGMVTITFPSGYKEYACLDREAEEA